MPFLQCMSLEICGSLFVWFISELMCSSCIFSGCKIKALRAKTNTYIKTPVRGEEPIFVVTGRKEDVTAAKREIQSAADHFSQIRASRRTQSTGSLPGSAGIPPGPPSPSTPGQVTIQVRVPYRVVGLVVGPKGATIKRIQQQTHTYIVTPSRDKEPVFEVTGSPENADQARKEIESHIALRTGGMIDSNGSTPNMNANMPPSTPCGPPHGNPNSEDTLNQLNDFHTNGIDSAYQDLSQDLISSIYNKGGPNPGSAFTAYNGALNSNNLLSSTPHLNNRNQDSSIFTFPPVIPNGVGGSSHGNGVPKMSDFHSNGTATNMSHSNGFSSNGYGGFYDNNDEGISSPGYGMDQVSNSLGGVWSDISGDQPSNVLPMFTSSSILPSRRTNSYGSESTRRLSPVLTDSIMNGHSSAAHNGLRRIGSDPITSGLNGMVPIVNGGTGSPTGSSNSSSSGFATTSLASLSEGSSSSSPTEAANLAALIRQQPAGKRQCQNFGEIPHLCARISLFPFENIYRGNSVVKIYRGGGKDREFP